MSEHSAESFAGLPWAVWPWSNCRARHIKAGRCELRRGHVGPHARDYGMYPWRWVEVDPDACVTGAKPPFSVTYIDPKVCATSTDQWFVMGTVNGDPRDQCGPVAICEYQPSAHTIAALLNTVTSPEVGQS